LRHLEVFKSVRSVPNVFCVSASRNGRDFANILAFKGICCIFVNRIVINTLAIFKGPEVKIWWHSFYAVNDEERHQEQ